jgi:putative flippase GtrA
MNFREIVHAAFFAPPPVPLPARLLRFLAIGTIGLATDVGSYTALFALVPNAAIGRAGSLIIATVVTWRLNRVHTFGASEGRATFEGLRYTLTALVAQGFNYGLFLVLRSMALGPSDQVLIVICAAIATVFSFAGQNLFTFRPALPADRTP